MLLALLLLMTAVQAQTMPLETSSQGSAPPPSQQQQQACGSCYGAEDPATGRQCCNSCSDVRTAYSAKAWSWPGEQRLVHAPVERLHVSTSACTCSRRILTPARKQWQATKTSSSARTSPNPCKRWRRLVRVPMGTVDVDVSTGSV